MNPFFKIDAVTTTAAGLKGRAKYTYNHAATAITEDSTPAMLHAFAALTDGAKAIVLQSGKLSNLYIRGERKGMAADEAATELEDAAAVLVSRKLRKIDHICAVAFLAEYIARQRKADEPTETPTDNTPSTMTANETKAPESVELTHAATSIVLAAENTCNIYQNHVEPLLRSLERKAAKGVTLSLDTLAKSSAMAVIIRESIKEVKRTSYDPFSANKDDRRAAALYLVNIYISEL